MEDIKRGEIILVDLNPIRGSKQGGVRPCVVIQNDIGNKYSPTTIIAPISSKKFTKEFPTNISLFKEDSGLDKDSFILLNQIKTIDKLRIKRKISSLPNSTMSKVDMAIKVSLGLS
jgi:mRNA interferase MazF